MKILLVNNLYGANARGGAERVVAQEAEALAAAGHQVVVAALSSRAERSDLSADQGKIRVIRLESTNTFHYLDLDKHGPVARLAWHILDMFDGRAARQFAAVLDAERPDVVHTHNLMGLGFMLPALLRRRRIRHVHTIHDVQLLHPSGLIASADLGLAARVYAFLMRLLMGSPVHVVFPSSYLLGLHNRRGFFRRAKWHVLPNPAPAADDAVRSWPGPRFLFAGQLEKHKGIRLLLEAWREASIPGATLEIFGDGAEGPALRESALPTGVTLRGKVAPEALAPEYRRVAYAVVPSLVIENAPTVIMESFAAGTPVVATAIGGIPELVTEGETGRLFPPGDVEALSAALRRAATESGWTEMSAHCRDFARARGMDAHLRTLVALYEGRAIS